VLLGGQSTAASRSTINQQPNFLEYNAAQYQKLRKCVDLSVHRREHVTNDIRSHCGPFRRESGSVLFIGNFFHPVGVLAVEHLDDGDVGHGRGGCGAVPMLFAWSGWGPGGIPPRPRVHPDPLSLGGVERGPTFPPERKLYFGLKRCFTFHKDGRCWLVTTLRTILRKVFFGSLGRSDR